MKIRKGFVTNSSSTSFIVSIKNNFSKDSFMSAIGADGSSPFNKIFEDLFHAIDNDKRNIQDAVLESGEKEVCLFLENAGFSQDTIQKVEGLLKEGKQVYYGELRSDGETAVEAFFCCESFVLCEDDIYFNGNIGGW